MVLNPEMVDPTGFRQFLDHLYELREDRCVQDKALAPRSTKVSDVDAVRPSASAGRICTAAGNGFTRGRTKLSGLSIWPRISQEIVKLYSHSPEDG